MKTTKILKEILKHIVLFGSLAAMATFITFVATEAQNKVHGLIIIFSGLWVGIITMLSLCYMLWPEELNKKLKNHN